MVGFHYKDFPKFDTRRYLVVLFALERMGPKATLHHISKEIDCTRAEVKRAIESAEKTFQMRVIKDGSVYLIDSWGIIDRLAALNLISLESGRSNSVVDIGSH